MKHQHSVTLKKLTTLQNEGTIDDVYVMESIEELKTFLSTHPSYFVLGKGSNIIINPNHSKGSCIRLSATMIESTAKHNLLTVCAGTPVNMLMKKCVEFSLSGLEFSAGVPATVGGMVAMNFGCWGKSIADVLHSIYIIDDTQSDRWVFPDELSFAYRYSDIQIKPWIVLAATFKLTCSKPELIKKNIDLMVKTRLEKQPLKEKTFGSVFKNPQNNFAGALIETAGLKGYELETVKVSDKHANFFINKGNASYEEIKKLITYVQETVKEKTGVLLELEVKQIE